MRCKAGHCTCAFHPLCARNNGQYLATREGPLGKPAYRIYCPQHSQAQREKDSGLAAAAAQVPPPPPLPPLSMPFSSQAQVKEMR